MNQKKKILFTGEANFLETGFSNISRGILNRISKREDYDIAEMGSYAKTSDPKSLQFNWKFYGVIPEDHDTVGQKLYNSDVEGQFGKFAFEKVLLDFKPDIVFSHVDAWMCLMPNSLIFKDLGQIAEIKDISIGDKVLTHTNSSQSVDKVGKRLFSGKIVKLKTSILSFYSEMTYNHPVLTIKKESNFLPKDISTAKFIDAEQLECGDHVLFPIPKFQTVDTEFTNEQLYGMGFFIANGCYLKWKGRDGIQLCGKPESTQLAINALASLDKKSYIHMRGIEMDKPHFIQRRLSSTYIANKMFEWFGEYAGEKTLPEWVFTLPVDKLAWFIKGAINGDGSLSKTRSGRYYSINKKLILQIWLCLLKCGIFSSVNAGTTKIGHRVFNRFLVNVPEHQYDKFEKLYRYGLPSKLECKKIINDNILIRIREKQEYIVKDQEVCNIEVKNDHTYVSYFVTHNCNYQRESPFRKYFKWMLMPCVDSEPQKQEWLEMYGSADLNLGYAQYAKNILEEESAGKIKIFDIASPGVDHNIFKILDRKSIRKQFNVNPDWNIIQFVGRNQKRKLFISLFEAFAKYLKYANQNLDDFNANNTYLHIHSSLPDVGIEFSKHLIRLGIGHKVLFTYLCQRCHNYWIDFYQSELTVCPQCNTLAGHMPNSSLGVSREELCNIYNLADLYVQYSVAGSLEMPLCESKCCGTPAMAVAYAAMKEQVTDVIGCSPINIGTYYWESDFSETGQARVYPDIDHTIQLFHKFFNTPKEIRESWRQAIRQDVLDKYTYDRAASIFEKAIDSLDSYDENLTWNYPKARLCPMSRDMPRFNSNIDFINWACVNILGDKSKIGSYWASELIKSLNIGYNIVGGGRQKFTHEDCLRMFMEMAAKTNHWEKQRVRLLQKETDNIRWQLL